jgi:glycosyltransferase involved in cell wall biosynthesis
MTSFSFITASFNPGAMIEDCLGSVARQDPVPGVNHEHIIVDDGSTDASVALIKASGYQ